MKTQLSHTDLIIAFESTDFVLKTQRQIAKDFAMSSVAFDESFEVDALNYDQIIDAVGKELENILNLGETATLQLLYQIDIPQADFLALTTDPQFISKMSDLIIRREAYKVYLRSQY